MARKKLLIWSGFIVWRMTLTAANPKATSLPLNAFNNAQASPTETVAEQQHLDVFDNNSSRVAFPGSLDDAVGDAHGIPVQKRMAPRNLPGSGPYQYPGVDLANCARNTSQSPSFADYWGGFLTTLGMSRGQNHGIEPALVRSVGSRYSFQLESRLKFGKEKTIREGIRFDLYHIVSLVFLWTVISGNLNGTIFTKFQDLELCKNPPSGLQDVINAGIVNGLGVVPRIGQLRDNLLESCYGSDGRRTMTYDWTTITKREVEIVQSFLTKSQNRFRNLIMATLLPLRNRVMEKFGQDTTMLRFVDEVVESAIGVHQGVVAELGNALRNRNIQFLPNSTETDRSGIQYYISPGIPGNISVLLLGSS